MKNSLFITNATIVTPRETLSGYSLRIEEGVIREIFPDAIEPTVGVRESAAFPLPVVDAKGAYLLPGIIDIHTDAMDMEIVPRPGADIPIPIAFRELEKKMSGCGFTTVFHSLHLGYDAADLQSRSRFSRKEVFETVSRISRGASLIHNKIHLRFEVSGVHAYDTCLELIEQGSIHLLSIMDHTPGQGQFSKEAFFKHMENRGLSKEKAEVEYEYRTGLPRIEGENLERMIRSAKTQGIPIASHDDESAAKVDFMHKRGVDICEFPVTFEAASHAHELGMHVAGGASNIIRGGSLSGNLSMREAVLKGVVNILCSDYYPPSILYALFLLHTQEGIPLHDAVNLASLNPAKATRLDSFTGSIEPGKHADLLLVKMQDGIPMVTHTMVGGSLVFQASHKLPVTLESTPKNEAVHA